MNKKNILFLCSILFTSIIVLACDGDDSTRDSDDIHDFIRFDGDIVVQGRQLILETDGNRQVFTARGVAYSPIPIGADFGDQNLGDIYFNDKNGDAFLNLFGEGTLKRSVKWEQTPSGFTVCGPGTLFGKAKISFHQIHLLKVQTISGTTQNFST